MKVLVFHPGTQHSAQAAYGLKKAGLLEAYVTSFSLQKNLLLGSLLRTFSPSRYNTLSQHRGHLRLDKSEIVTWPPYLLATRINGFNGFWGKNCANYFEKWAGNEAVRRKSVIMGFNANSLHSFRAAQQHAIPCILDQSIAYTPWINDFASELDDKFPDWGPSWIPTREHIDRETEEAERADLILCGSEFCRETLIVKGIPENKLSVVEYGADTTRFYPRIAPRTNNKQVKLLFVGSLQKRKGLPYLLETTRLLRKHGCHLTIVGRSDIPYNKLEPYRDCCTVINHTLYENMPALFREHDIYVFPSLIEGSSLSIYEALASGLPVVTTLNSGSIVRDGEEGFIVPAGDGEALTEAVEKLVTDSDLRSSMGLVARKRAESFGDWHHYGNRLTTALLSNIKEFEPILN